MRFLELTGTPFVVFAEDARRGRVISVAATAASVSAAARRLIAGPSLVDGQGASIDFLAVQGAHGRVCLGVVTELHESEALGSTGVAVGDDPRRFRLAERGEELAQLG